MYIHTILLYNIYTHRCMYSSGFGILKANKMEDNSLLDRKESRR